MPAALAGQIRVGLIGAGLIGRAHSLMLRQIADRTENSVRVVAVADVVPDSAHQLAARWPGARAYGTAEELVRDSSVDAVWICTPTAMHRENCIAAAQAGKHIFCEKPLAMSAAQASEMHRAIRAAGVLAQVGLVLRFSPVYTVIKEMFAAPEAGRMLAVTMRDDQDFPIRGAHPSTWRNDALLTAGGTLIEHSVHDFDLMSWMFGPIDRLYCRTRNLNGAPGVEDFAATEFEFRGGFHGHLVSIWHRMPGRISNRRLEVFAENLYAATDHDVRGRIVVQRGDSPDEETIDESEVIRRFERIVLHERPYLAPMRELMSAAYALEDLSFLAALRRECDVDPPFADGIAAQRIVEAAYSSAARGTSVEVSDNL